MRAYLSIPLILLSIVIGIGCKSNPKDDKTKLNISCSECSGLEVSLTRYSIIPTGPKEIYKSEFDSSGLAKIEFVLSDTLTLLLEVGNREDAERKFFTTLYFEPGADIDLAIENGFPEFEGDLKIINSYYSKLSLIDKERWEYSQANIRNSITGSGLEKQVFLDSLMQFGTALKNQIKSDNSISDYYRQILMDYSSFLEIIHHMHYDTYAAIIEKNNNDVSVVLDSTLSNAFREVKLHPGYINLPSYTWFVSNRLLPIFDDIMEYREEHGIKVGEYEYMKGAIGKDAKLNDYRELLMALFIAQRSRLLSDYNEGFKFVDLFQKDYPHSNYLEALNYIISEYYDLTSGMPMKDLEMHDMDGKLFKLSDLRGKLLYIDVWATWCGPCVEELEYSVELSKKYSNYPDLKFIYVSVDGDTASWKKYLRKHSQIKGIHGIQNVEFLPDSSNVTNLYKIQGIPRYILIDKEGKIISSNARRPSQLLNENYLDSLLVL